MSFDTINRSVNFISSRVMDEIRFVTVSSPSTKRFDFRYTSWYTESVLDRAAAPPSDNIFPNITSPLTDNVLARTVD